MIFMNKYTYIIIAIGIFTSIAFVSGYRIGQNKVLVAWNAQKVAIAEESQKQQRQLQQVNLKVDEQYQKGLSDGQDELQTALDKLAVANERLRKRTTPGQLPKTTTTSGGHNATTESRFLDASGAASIIRLAAAADNNTRQLTACQEILISQQSDH